MTRYHSPQIELVHEGVGDVFDFVFGADAEETKRREDLNKEKIKPLEKVGHFRVEELDFIGIRGALSSFILQLRALPPRPKSQLAGTLGKIARNPKRFLERCEAYEPEAAALVLNEYAKGSEANRQNWIAWELGQSLGPAPQEIVLAAKIVRERLDAQIKAGQKRGRPEQVHVTELAIRLSRIFLGAGGTLTRNQRLKEGDETGPFHRFLKIVLEPVRPFARRFDVIFNIPTMVRKARVAQKKPTRAATHTICPQQDSPPLNTAP